jgi:hypothetical protein
MGAYQRLRRATRRVSVADRAARRETESVNA